MKATTLAKAEQIVVIDHNQTWTTSLIVAKYFGKRHDNVLAAIQKKGGSERFSRLNFKAANYIDEQGKERKMYNISRDGFMKLVFGFTGPKADQLQEAFIEEFNRMERELRRVKEQQLAFDWQETRTDGKDVRRSLTDRVQAFVDYAKEQGSKTPNMYYMVFTKMEDRALFEFEVEKGGYYEPFRDCLTKPQLSALAQAERITEKAIMEGMAADVPYKEIYTIAKERVVRFADLIGKSTPGVEALPAPRKALAA